MKMKMSKKNSLIGLGLGFVFIAMSILINVLKNYVMLPMTDERTSHLISVLLSLFFVYGLTYLFVRRLRRKRRGHVFRRYRKDLLFFGFLWFVMSFISEVVQQYLVNDPTVSVTWENYNILKGQLMGIVLFSELIAPILLGSVMLRYREHEHVHRRDVR